jgi:hypothetical protein
MGVALGLLDLEHGLNVGAREVLLPHERRDEVSVLLVRQRAEHGHERKLVVEVADGIGAGDLGAASAGASGDLRDLRGAELDDACNGLLDAGSNSGECLLRTLDYREQVVVRAEAHAGDLLDVHGLDCGPHCGGVVVAVDDVSALRAGQVGGNVTCRLLLAVLELVKLALVRQLELSVARSFLPRESDGSNGSGSSATGWSGHGVVGLLGLRALACDDAEDG